MKLTERQRDFAVSCFAIFMTRTEVTNAFMQEFAHELPPPPPEPKFNRQASDQKYRQEKQHYIDQYLEQLHEKYQIEYGDNADEKFQQDIPQLQQTLNEEYEKTFPQDVQQERKEQLERHKEDVEEHYKKVKTELSNQLRRFNITHKQFPEKYSELFNQVRMEYIQSHQTKNLQDTNNVQTELETLYGYAKLQVFHQKKPIEVVRHLNVSLKYLKVIMASNAINSQQDTIDVTPDEPNKLTE